MRFVAVVVASFALACGARPAEGPAGSFHVNALGTVASFEDESPVDGPIRFTVATDEGRSYRFFFESMYTRPSPTAERRALFEKLQGNEGWRPSTRQRQAARGSLLARELREALKQDCEDAT